MGNVISLQLCGEVNLIQCKENGETFCSAGEIQILKDKLDNLRALKTDVETKIEYNGNPQVEVSNVVKMWIEKVGELDGEVSRIVASDCENGMARCFLCSKNESGILGRIKRVDDLVRQEDNRKDSIFMPRHRIADKGSIFIPPSADASIVGMEDVMSQVLRYLDDATVRVVCIHGMGGAGKTTLAKQLKRKLQFPSSSPSTSAAGGQGSRKFGVIIWAVVSRNLDIRKLQRDIAAELGIHERSGFKDANDETSRARFIADYLKERRFLLVLDDVWEKLDLRRIGIPEFLEDIGNKIVLTTRQEKVCTEMGARKSTVKVGCLGEEESWELFKKAIQWTDDEFEHVYEIARDIVPKCGGLPLALITIARAMATKLDISLWRRACELLKDSPQSIEGMEDVYRLLEFSYDNLKNEEYKSCLLYSALFREDEEIKIETMVDYWIGGGSVSVDGNMSFDIVRLRRYGRFIISELTDACLLERGRNEDYVKVHDAIRDMILFRLKRDNGENRIVSYAGKEITGTHIINVGKWRAASMLSFYYNPKLKELVIEGEEEDKNLQVLLLNVNDIYELPRRLFEYCPLLRVLDLSHTNLRSIPASLFSLKSLQYLNLSGTQIGTLPKEMLKLSSLIQLELSDTRKLYEIPNGLFSSFSNLQFLNILYCYFFTSGMNRLQVLENIRNLSSLEDVRLTIDGNVDVVKILNDSDSLSISITVLHVKGVDLFEDDLILQWMGSRLKKLEWLDIDGEGAGDCKEDLVIDDGHFSELKKLYISSIKCCHIILEGQALQHLTRLQISACHKLTDLACLCKLPNLELLPIIGCDEIKELMGPSQSEVDEIIHRQSFLPKVKSIDLSYCTNLLRISGGRLQLHSLQKLLIYDCPSLKDISMIDSPKKLEISCKAKWWEDLRWENSGSVPPSNFIPNFFC